MMTRHESLQIFDGDGNLVEEQIYELDEPTCARLDRDDALKAALDQLEAATTAWDEQDAAQRDAALRLAVGSVALLIRAHFDCR